MTIPQEGPTRLEIGGREIGRQLAVGLTEAGRQSALTTTRTESRSTADKQEEARGGERERARGNNSGFDFDSSKDGSPAT